MNFKIVRLSKFLSTYVTSEKKLIESYVMPVQAFDESTSSENREYNRIKNYSSQFAYYSFYKRLYNQLLSCRLILPAWKSY